MAEQVNWTILEMILALIGTSVGFVLAVALPIAWQSAMAIVSTLILGYFFGSRVGMLLEWVE